MIPLDTFDMPNFLARFPMFRAMSTSELQRMAHACLIKRIAKGEMVFRVGDPCDAFHLVVSGEVKLYVSSDSGQEKVIEIACGGQSFGEGLIFADKPFVLNAQALTDVVLVYVSKNGILHEISKDTRFSVHVLAGLSHRLHGMIKDVEDYALRNGVQRLARFLLRDVELNADATQNAIVVTLPASKATVASRLSLTPEYFSRVLHELEAARLIQIEKRDICIKDVYALASFGAMQNLPKNQINSK